MQGIQRTLFAIAPLSMALSACNLTINTPQASTDENQNTATTTTESVSASVTATPTVTVTPSASISNTVTPSISATPSVTTTPTAPLPSMTGTLVPQPTMTVTVTPPLEPCMTIYIEPPVVDHFNVYANQTYRLVDLVDVQPGQEVTVETLGEVQAQVEIDQQNGTVTVITDDSSQKSTFWIEVTTQSGYENENCTYSRGQARVQFNMNPITATVTPLAVYPTDSIDPWYQEKTYRYSVPVGTSFEFESMIELADKEVLYLDDAGNTSGNQVVVNNENGQGGFDFYSTEAGVYNFYLTHSLFKFSDSFDPIVSDVEAKLNRYHIEMTVDAELTEIPDYCSMPTAVPSLLPAPQRHYTVNANETLVAYKFEESYQQPLRTDTSFKSGNDIYARLAEYQQPVWAGDDLFPSSTPDHKMIIRTGENPESMAITYDTRPWSSGQPHPGCGLTYYQVPYRVNINAQ